MNWPSAWRLSVGTLTVFPVAPPAKVDHSVGGRAILVAPLAVLPLAVIASVLGHLAALTAWPAPLSGVAVVAALALGTRALHLDGLADTVDGLGGGRDRDTALTIMRRGDIGPMGAAALILVLAGQSVAASALTGSWAGAALLAVLIASSRSSLVIACRQGVPAARSGGLGAAVAGSVRAPVALLAGLPAGLAVVGAAVMSGRPWWLGLLAAAVGAVIAYGSVAVARRRLGGITGDVLGATVELTLLTLLLVITLR